MGRKKKRFIDKKNAATFSLVHRSQNDPHLDETGETQMVLASKEDKSGLEDRTSEKRKYGIYYKDDYNYMQHLKESKNLYPVSIDNAQEKKTPLNLPSDLFGAELNVEGLKRVVPITGPQPDWDPEILEALDRMEGDHDSDCNESLDDDFVLQANGGESSLSVHSNDFGEVDKNTSEPWWLQRTDFKSNEDAIQLADEHDDNSDHSGYDLEEENERRTARFTEYSMTSSVVPRSEGLTNLDDRFEEFMIEYDDNQLGPIEEERCNDSDNEGEFENAILNNAVEEFIKKYDHKTTRIIQCEKKDLHNVVSTREGDTVANKDTNDCSSNDSEEEKECLPVEAKQKWDCESILSTYSNLYNHPTFIKDPPRSHLKEKVHSQSSDVPSVENILVTNVSNLAPKLRPRNETKEEQKLRKQAVKQERKEHRQAKKAMKMVFKKEHLRQERELISNPVLNKIG